MDKKPVVINTRELMEWTGWKRQYVYNLIESGKLPAIQTTDGGTYYYSTEIVEQILSGQISLVSN